MRWKRWLNLLPLVLTGCGVPDGPAANAVEVAGLEAAAVARGLVRTPRTAPLTGLYARGGDRICIVGRGGGARIGVVSASGCAAAGVVTRAGRGLAVTLGAANDCAFDARFDGERIGFPARLPDGCARFCNGRATLSAMSVDRLSESAAEASALRDRQGRLVCGD